MVSTTEHYSDPGPSQQKTLVSHLETTLGVQYLRAVPTLSHGELLSTNTTACIDTLQLARTQKQNYRSQKARIVHLETFTELWTLMGRTLFLLAGVAGFPGLGGRRFHRGLSCTKGVLVQ